ncbi:hypothetical protein RJ40_11525 [Methanofollis aquaemaris]|uniref:Uncharacterized protein n=1 Tax=Methanofollis aquaemaris TaxID=126734 RepID=A0A8A3S8T2_9EURY|nr:hypothetical protein [Methanofollis aquaemaris]QSZ68080.1 hypothetical protein RJ40_11525 [Methanofollis aquaemaris]
MPLTPAQFERMEYLLGKVQHTSLTPYEQDELRRYVVVEQPGADDVTFETVVTLGLIIVGAYLLYKYVESAA